MSVLDWFKTAPKVVDNVFDKDKGLLTQVGQWIGHQQLTPEEMVKYNESMVKSVQAYAVATLDESTERSQTRRTIAVQWFKMQVWLIKLTVLCVFVDYLIYDLFEKESSFTDSISEIAFSPLLWGVTSGIGLFFWGSHALRSSKFAKGE